MSIGNDYNSNDTPITDAQSDNFAATPVWDRGRKRRGFSGGRKVTPEARTFAAEPDPVAQDEMLLDAPMTTTNSTLAADEPMAAPIGRTTAPRTVRSHASSGASASVIAGALIAVVAVGGVAWYATRDHSGGVPTLASAPESTTSQVAAAPAEPAAPAAQPMQMASNAAPATPAPLAERTPPRERIMPAHRARPATAARAAGETGVNASTTAALPDGPQPYSSVNPGAAPQPVNPTPPPSTVQAPPATTAPAQTAPATPAPPPVQPQQAPSTAPADQQTPPADTTPPSA